MRYSPQLSIVFILSFLGVVTGHCQHIYSSYLDSLKSESTKENVEVGYGVIRKNEVSSALAVVHERDFNPGLITTAEQLIMGRVAGTLIIPIDGAPGSGSQIQIRGNASLTGNSVPLIVIDGVPVDNDAAQGSASPLDFINANDIETFTILKDASALSIYGFRGNNGVIIITTKKGIKGEKFQIDFKSLGAFSSSPKKVSVLTPDQFRTVVNQKGGNTSLLGNSNTDWQNTIYRSGFSQQQNLSIKGGIEFLPYRISLGWLNQEGSLKTSDLGRLSGALNLNPRFFDDHLKIDLNLKRTSVRNQIADTRAIAQAVSFDPTQPIRASNNYGNYFEWLNPDGTAQAFATRNPLSMLEQNSDREKTVRTIGNIHVAYNFHFLPDLSVHINLGLDKFNRDSTVMQPVTLPSTFGFDNRLNKSQSFKSTVGDIYLNYSRNINKFRARVDITGGASSQHFNSTGTENTASFNPNTNENFISENYFYQERKLLAIFGRLNYVYRNKFLLNVTIRRDGSSLFSNQNKWNITRTIALGWDIKEENFLKQIQIISALKFRISNGILGSNNGSSNSLKNVETKIFNTGFDFGFFDGRLSGSLDYFIRNTINAFSFQPVVYTNFVQYVLVNGASVSNAGFEASLDANLVRTRIVNWRVGFNGTLISNEITSLSVNSLNTGNFINGINGPIFPIQLQTQGSPLNSFYAYQQVYSTNGKPIEGLYVDRNNNNMFDGGDKYVYHSPNPKVYLGFNSMIDCGRWKLAFLLRGSFGNHVYNNTRSANGSYSSILYATYLSNMTTDLLQTGFKINQFFSNYYIENAAFLRMENISVSRDFGRVYENRIGMRLSAVIQNAFVITRYSGPDPEVPGGIDYGFYPRPRTYSLGLNLSF